jgi:serine protease
MRLRSITTALAATAALVATSAAPAAAATNDPLRRQQWGLDQVPAEQAWSASTGAGTIVAVVDSGVDLNHPDLQGQLVPGVTTVGCGPQQQTCGNGSWVGMDGEAQEADTHGTHVSGIVAAATDNGTGVAGVAPDARTMPIKSLEDGSGSFEEIANGIRYAVDHGADVVNLSLGAIPGAQALTITGLDSAVTEAIAYATSRGVLVVAASGNESFPVCDTPSFEPGALCVTSTDRNELPSWFSNGAIKPDLMAVAAPGGAGLVNCADDIVSTVPQGTGNPTCGESDYDYYAGTSMATPHVAGVAALLHAQGRDRANVLDGPDQHGAHAGLAGARHLHHVVRLRDRRRAGRCRLRGCRGVDHDQGQGPGRQEPLTALLPRT